MTHPRERVNLAHMLYQFIYGGAVLAVLCVAARTRRLAAPACSGRSSVVSVVFPVTTAVAHGDNTRAGNV